ncbi:Phenylalanyl-tRNA synthetase beta chain (EC [Olavius sp. associated proteobacterium Delta 1]|nr:Phenylalanyl-tRNA synthetase beta chain (EC [Olavius sp. associated proteobacterium Delta 1]
MKVSLSWLKDYVDVTMDPAVLADALTMAGLEVDSVSDRYAYLDGVIVGRVDEVAPHPNADKLTLCRVNTGEGQVSVVCGAPNVKQGMLAALAKPGTVLPHGTRLEKNIIRGETSEGMLCSDAELGLGDDPGGIMSLNTSLKPGTGLAQALDLSDTVFELDLTPNRPDCLSVIGIAREIAIIQNTPLKYPDYAIEDKADTIHQMTSVKIEAPDHCPRYAARLVATVKVTPSPFWLQNRLLSVGLRPINNIVDITNFVMLETGQPLHAFDFDNLTENRIVVRLAAAGEKFTTLDEKERSLDSEMLMICDGEKAVGVGGVMGGLNSEIENDTARVLIEGAYFIPVSIRRTSKKLGLNTDASHRFERGVDPEGCVRAVNRAAKLMVEIAGGTLVDGIIDEYPRLQTAKDIELGVKRTNRLLGTDLDRNQIQQFLESIEFKVEPIDRNEDRLKVTPPTFRVDVSRREDLMEEVARLSGYNNIPTTFPAMPAEGRPPAHRIRLRNRIKGLMSGFGFTEAIAYSFVPESSCDQLRMKEPDPRRSMIRILNPLSEDQAAMRTSLVPGILETMRHNMARQIKNLKLFETGKIFLKTDQQVLPREPEMLIALWTGARTDASWHSRENPCDFYDIKGAAEALMQALKLDGIRFTAMADDACEYTRPGHSAQIMASDSPVGLVGEINRRVSDSYDLRQTAFIFELDLEKIAGLIPQTRQSNPIPRFPAIYRDITIIVDRGIETQSVLEAAENFQEKLIENLNLFDVFEGDPIAAGRKSVSFRITYRSPGKTLVDDDVNDLHKSITERLLNAFDATLP